MWGRVINGVDSRWCSCQSAIYKESQTFEHLRLSYNWLNATYVALCRTLYTIHSHIYTHSSLLNPTYVALCGTLYTIHSHIYTHSSLLYTHTLCLSLSSVLLSRSPSFSLSSLSPSFTRSLSLSLSRYPYSQRASILGRKHNRAVVDEIACIRFVLI